MTHRITSPRNLPAPADQALPDNCLFWPGETASPVNPVTPRVARPAIAVTMQAVCCQLLIDHHAGLFLLDSVEQQWCLEWAKYQWIVPSPGYGWQLWEWSESRIHHGLTRGEFRQSYFWRAFQDAVTRLAK